MHITIFVAAMGKHARVHEEVEPNEPLCLSAKILIAAALNLFPGNDPLLATSPDSSEYAYQSRAFQISIPSKGKTPSFCQDFG